MEQPDAKDGRTDDGNTPIAVSLAPQQGQEPNQPTDPENQELGWRDLFTGDRANWSIAFLTFVLAVIGYFQWKATHTANEHNVVVERASVAMTTLRVDESTDAGPPVRTITIGLTNHGHTTATLDECIVILRISDMLPPNPTYNRPASSTAPPMLAAGESTNWRERIGIGEIEHAYVDKTKLPNRIWVYGRVIFTDTFGDRHEYGFGREWRADDPLLADVQDRRMRFGYPEWRSYNYARPLKRQKW